MADHLFRIQLSFDSTVEYNSTMEAFPKTPPNLKGEFSLDGVTYPIHFWIDEDGGSGRVKFPTYDDWHAADKGDPIAYNLSVSQARISPAKDNLDSKKTYYGNINLGLDALGNTRALAFDVTEETPNVLIGSGTAFRLPPRMSPYASPSAIKEAIPDVGQARVGAVTRVHPKADGTRPTNG